MTTLTLKLTGMANGGLAVGRDHRGRPVFVPFALSGETVKVRLTRQTERYAHAELLEIVHASPERVAPRCPHFGVCGGCHWQHMDYPAQLRAKQTVTADQLQRLGGLRNANVQPALPHPAVWSFRHTVELFPVEDGGLGYWSPSERRVIPISACPILHPRLEEAIAGLDVDLPGLRRLTLRLGDDDSLLAALEVEGVEPPELSVDFPVSVAIVLPNRTAAALIGDPYLTQTVRDRTFRISPGCDFPPSPAAAQLLVETVQALADLRGDETVLETPGGVGLLPAFLAGGVAQWLAIEPNPDAVADAAGNLDDLDNVAFYEGEEEEVLPGLPFAPDVVILQPAERLSSAVVAALARWQVGRLICLSRDSAQLAAVARQLTSLGWRPVAIRPIDMRPHSYETEVASLWRRD